MPTRASADEPQTGLLGSVVETTTTVTDTTAGLVTSEPAPAAPSASTAEPAGIPGLSLPTTLDPVADVTTPLLAPVAPVLENGAPVVETLQPAVDATASLLEASEPLLTPVAPILDTAGPVIEASAPVVGAVAGPAVEVVASLSQPVFDVAAPLVVGVVEPVIGLVEPVIDQAGETAAGVLEPVVDLVTPVVDIVAPVVEVVPPVLDGLLPDIDVPGVERPPIGSLPSEAPSPQQPSQVFPPQLASALPRPTPSTPEGAIRTVDPIQFGGPITTTPARVVPIPGISASTNVASAPVLSATGAQHMPLVTPTRDPGSRLQIPAADTAIAEQSGAGSNGGLLSLHVPGFSATPRSDRSGSFAALVPVLGMLAVYLWLRGCAYRPIAARPALHLIFTPPR